MRFTTIDRLEDLDDHKLKERHYRQIAELLENEKYSKVPFGAQSFIYLMNMRIGHYEHNQDGQKCLSELKELTKIMALHGFNCESVVTDFTKFNTLMSFEQLAKEEDQF